MPVRIASGVICMKGIVVNENIYSCSKAIKEQWFLKVMDTGPINVILYLDSDHSNEILLLFDNGFVPCLQVTKTDVPSDYLQRYFDHMKMLKQKFRNSKL